jgi:hypothetical protein
MQPPGDSRSPFQQGFSFLREEPLLLAAELAWRWCFGLAAWLLVLGGAAFFLDSLRVSDLDLLFFGSMQPALERAAINHVLQGTLLRAVWMKVFALAGLTVMWAFGAAVGRAGILRNLVSLCGGEDHDEEVGWQFRPMLQLHLLRALWTWSALGCFVAAFLLGTVMMQSGRAARGAFFYGFGVALSAVFGSMLNWLFGVAPIFCIRNQLNARDAVARAIDFTSRQGGRLIGLWLAFLALRAVWVGSMFFLVLAPTELSRHLAVGWVLLMMGALALVYFAGADALSLARLGAYVSLAEIDSRPVTTPTTPVAPEVHPGLAIPDGFDELPGFIAG